MLVVFIVFKYVIDGVGLSFPYALSYILGLPSLKSVTFATESCLSSSLPWYFGEIVIFSFRPCSSWLEFFKELFLSRLFWYCC